MKYYLPLPTKRTALGLLILMLIGAGLNGCSSTHWPGPVASSEQVPGRMYMDVYPLSMELPEGAHIYERSIYANENYISMRIDPDNPDIKVIIGGIAGYKESDLVKEPSRIHESANRNLSLRSSFEELSSTLKHVNGYPCWETCVELKTPTKHQKGVISSLAAKGCMYRITLEAPAELYERARPVYDSMLSTIQIGVSSDRGPSLFPSLN